MSDLIKAFRTITRCGIFRQVSVGGVPTLVPIALAAPPEEITIDPKDSIEKLMVKACDGRKVVGFTYPDASDPEVEIKFSMAVMELESLMHGKVVAPATGSVEVKVFFEFNSAAVPPARGTGVIGQTITAQTEADSKAIVSYIDGATKTAKKITVKDAEDTLTGDQCKIGAAGAFTLSDDLVEMGVDIQAWVPCTVSGATIVTSESVGLFTIYAQGISYDNSPRSLIIYNCSRTDSAALTDKSERTIKLSILQSVLSESGLGWDTVDLPQIKSAC